MTGLSGRYVGEADGARLHLDVDGPGALAVASGADADGSEPWFAELGADAPSRWSGVAVRNMHSGSSDETPVRITVTREQPATLSVVFGQDGEADQIVGVYQRRSAFFRDLDLEVDAVAGHEPVLEFETHAHPERPADLPNESLDLATVLERAGFDVTLRVGTPLVPASAAHTPDEPVDQRELWSDAELHDAMLAHWSRVADRPQWALWVLFAGLHEAPPRSLGNMHPRPEQLHGIMFDRAGPTPRQGAAIFNAAIPAAAPADAHADAWVRRQRFFTAVHEIGHALNLSHPHARGRRRVWRPWPSNPKARSFLAYPWKVEGFFESFDYTFEAEERLFLRHAPEHLVQPGGSLPAEAEPALMATGDAAGVELSLHTTREPAVFPYLLPVVLTVRLRNTSGAAVRLSRHVLQDADAFQLLVGSDHGAARILRPFARRCWEPATVTLAPGEDLSVELFASAGLDGWLLAEPGRYELRARLELEGGEVLSEALVVRIARPGASEEESLAPDLFREDVARLLAFGGSRRLPGAEDALRELVDRLPQHPTADHALVALGRGLWRPFRFIDAGGAIGRWPADPTEARRSLVRALFRDPVAAATNLGHGTFAQIAMGLVASAMTRGWLGLALSSLVLLESTLRRSGAPAGMLGLLAEERRRFDGGELGA